jgi:DUF4097 and DUF4098 domain-containing protein YvlB
VSSAYPWAAEAVVTLPAGVTLDIENDAGSIDVEGNNGATTVAVEAGNVAISDNTGDVDINLDAGNVFLSRTTGVATVDVDAGDISVTGQSGDLTATFDNGEAGIQSNAGNVTARGENGDIIITAAPPANGSVIVELVNGTIEIAVPATFAADLDLQSTFGLVRDDLSSFTVTNLQRSPATFSNVVTATLNGGGGTIQADLLTGTIRFEGL